MIRLIRGELYKARTTMVPWVMAILVAVLAAGGVLLVFHLSAVRQFGPGVATPAWGTPSTPAELRDLVDFPVLSVGFSLPVVLGVLLATTEYRHKTITNAFLVTPKRWQVVTAKAIVAALGGLALAVVSLVVSYAVAAPFLAGQGGSVHDFTHQAAYAASGLLLSYALLGILGVGVGTLLRNQVAALITTLAWFLIAEGILGSIFPSYFRWLVSGVVDAAARVPLGGLGDRNGPTLTHIFPTWGGTVALLAYGVGITVIGYLLTTRRDVT